MSSQANPNPQHEPTMEEILASIRKIISEDQPAEGAKGAARPQAIRPQPVPEPPSVRLAAAAARPDLDVLDLTDEVNDDEPAPALPVVRATPATPVALPMPPAPAHPPTSVIESEVIVQSIESTEAGEREDDLVPGTTRFAAGRAFSNLNGQAPNVAPRGSSIEAIFAEAVQQAFRPALREWIGEHSNDVTDQLRPMIQAWMEEHLPPLIEAAVLRERPVIQAWMDEHVPPLIEAAMPRERPVIQAWMDEHIPPLIDAAMPKERPVIQAWMDEHVPPLIEAAVLKEISRAFARKP